MLDAALKSLRFTRLKPWRLLAVAFFAIAAPTAALAARGYVTANVNMRAGPGTDYPVVNTVPNGAHITINGCLSDVAWCDVSFSGDRGWISADYLNYFYQNRYVYLPDYVDEIDVPIVTFSLDTYWRDYYVGRPWYHRRAHWARFWRNHGRYGHDRNLPRHAGRPGHEGRDHRPGQGAGAIGRDHGRGAISRPDHRRIGKQPNRGPAVVHRRASPRPHVARPHVGRPHMARPHINRQQMSRPHFSRPQMSRPHMGRPSGMGAHARGGGPGPGRGPGPGPGPGRHR